MQSQNRVLVTMKYEGNNWLFLFVLVTAIQASHIFAASYPEHLSTTNQGEGAPQTSDASSPSFISGNPMVTRLVVGTGQLGRFLKIPPDSGIRLGGIWIANGNTIFGGGSSSRKGTGNNLVIIDLTLNAEKLMNWRGGTFGFEYLQYNGQDTNGTSGAVQGFNSISSTPPFRRSELYQAWLRQSFYDDQIVIRIGKSIPSYDFNNVTRPIYVLDESENISSTSGLLYTPIYVNSSLLGVLPGYYDSAFGATLNIAPSRRYYLSVGAYDGHLANGVTTGRTGPHFNGYYFYIGETGIIWMIGEEQKPGRFSIGAWRQTGNLTTSDEEVEQNGAHGLYLFGSQRIWNRHPGVDNSGIVGLFQYGINNSKILEMTQYVGLGLTAFGLTREQDSFGFGMALAWLNQNLFERKREVMFQAYYQISLRSNMFLVPALTYIPFPGTSRDIKPTWAGTLQAMVPF